MPTSEQVAAQARAAYVAALEAMEAAHEAFLANLGRPGADVHTARSAFDAAEEEMRRARRWWWVALATARQDPTARQDEFVSDAPSGD